MLLDPPPIVREHSLVRSRTGQSRRAHKCTGHVPHIRDTRSLELLKADRVPECGSESFEVLKPGEALASTLLVLKMGRQQLSPGETEISRMLE